jgi:GMP synthase-like glutamine amidotransferase
VTDAPPRALFLRHHEEDDPGLVGAALERRGYEVVTQLVDDDTVHVVLDGVDLLGVLGSKWSVYDHDRVGAWLDAELEAIREADRRGVAVLGICFGAQSLCVAMGGRVEPAPSLELGWVDLPGAPSEGIPPGPWFQFHSDQCLPPSTATVLTRNDVCVQAFRTGPHLGVQFHPELEGGQLSRWFAAGAEAVAVAAGVAPSALLAETNALEHSVTARVDELVASFLARAA